MCGLFCFRLKHAQSELKKKQSELKNTEKSYKKDKDVHDAIEKSKSKLEVTMFYFILLVHNILFLDSSGLEKNLNAGNSQIMLALGCMLAKVYIFLF